MDQSLAREAFHMFLPFMLGGIGMVYAGVVLESIQRWDVFIHYSEVLVMVPALLGLKGNIEMTLASRLSTSANTGVFQNAALLKETIGANIAVSQLQAIVVGLLSSVIAVLTNLEYFTVEKTLVLMTSSLLTASVTSLLLGLLLSAIIVISHRVGVNPDNVATPIAASLGDFCTLWILSRTLYILDLKSALFFYVAIVIGFFLLLPLLVLIAKNHSSTAVVLSQGWQPVLLAMCISSCGGLILQYGVQNLAHLASFQPLMNGLGGNIASIQASRLSTELHQMHKSDRDLNIRCPVHKHFSRFLMALSVCGHCLLCVVVIVLSPTSIGLLTVIVYLLASTVQVLLLLKFAGILVPFLWDRGQDPDNAAIPYLTSLGDLIGTGLLAVGLSLIPSSGPTVQMAMSA